MLYVRRALTVAMPMALLAFGALPTSAKTGEDHSAVSLLLKAQQQYDGQDFPAARTALWEAYGRKDQLSEPQRKMLEQRLGEVDHAIQQSVIAKSLYSLADRAMQQGDWRLARDGFSKAAGCPYLPTGLRSQAREKCSQAEMKLAVQLASDSPKSAPKKEVSSSEAISSRTLPGEQVRKIKMDMLVAQGKDALNKNQAAKAAGYFQRALAMDPDNEAIRRQLDYARQQTARPSEAGILSQYVQQQRIAKQIAETDIAAALRRSMELMAQPKKQEDFEAADQAAQMAKNILQNNKRLFPTTQYREKLGKIKSQIKWVADKREAWEKKQVLQTVKKINEAERKRQAEVRMQKERKVAELTLRAHALRREREYQQALRVMDQIVELDPENTWAQDNIYLLRQFISLQAQRKMADAGKIELAKLSADLRGTEIPWYDKIRYPKDWKELTARRERYGASFGTDSPENLRVRKKLRERIPKVKLIDVKFEDAVDYLRDVSNANIYVNWGALEVDSPDVRSKQVNVILSDVTVEKALRLILEDAGGGFVKLGYVISEGVINVSTQDNLNALTYPRVYDIRDLLARVPNFIGPRVSLDAIGEMDLGGDSSSSSSSSSGGSLFEDDTRDTGDEDTEDVALTRSEMVGRLREMITTTVDRESWYPNGNGQINELSGSLVITQTAENHRLIQELIAKLRESRTIQISIEARFITVQTGFLSQIGVDLDFYFNIGSQIGGPAGGTSTTTDPFTGATVPLRNPSSWNQAGNNADASLRKMSPIGISQNSSGFGSVFNQQTNVANGIGSMITAPAMSIAGTFLDDLQVDFLIQATQAHSSTRTLTAPRVTLFNGQRAYVSVATQQAFISGVEPIVSENASALQPIVQYAPTGTTLDVDATVSHDRRYVTMTLHPQVTTLNGAIREVPVLSGGNEIFIGLPNLTTQLIETTVSVPDGGTLLIGGQKLSGEIEHEMGVPVVSKIPVINRAFTNKGKLRDEQTLLILVKPTIIIQDESELDPRLRKEEPAFEKGVSYIH